MASTTFPTNNDDDSDPFVIRRTWSSEDDNTATAGSNRSPNKPEQHEILVKWQMPGNLVLVDAKKQLVALIKELLLCFPDEVTWIDHNSREWVFTEGNDEEKLATDMDKEAATKVHPVRDRNQKLIKWIAITKFMTSRDLPEWKNNDHFYSLVQETKTYMFPHPFSYDVWDISSIGFIKDIHVAHYSRDYLHDKITQIIKKQEKVHPTFQLIPQRITNKDKTATTRAYTVQCAKAEARQLIHLLTHGDFRSNPLFIPFKYKTAQPDVFTKCIRKQNEVYHKTWVIKLVGISSSSMEYIRNNIMTMPGVFHVVPTRRLPETGEWKVLVDHTKCSYVHRQLTTSWRTIVAKIPEDVLTQEPPTFSTPGISSQKVRNYQDESSDADSYGSILTTGTETSIGLSGYEEQESMNEPPPQYMYPSYAAAAAKSAASQDSPQMSSPTASSYTNWQREKSELEDMIQQQALKIDRIQADLNARVSRTRDLEEQLAQAIELAHSRDARHEEMLQRFEQLMAHHNMPNTGPGPNAPPLPPPPPSAPPESITHGKVTPPMRPMTTQSPPPKKSNQSHTPPKTMYPVFRQYDNNPPRFKRPQTLLTQPMDTEDGITNPKPGVQTGTQE